MAVFNQVLMGLAQLLDEKKAEDIVSALTEAQKERS